MRNQSVFIISSFALLLTACGGGNKLSFKNSDEVIKSYKAATADMTEAERLEFRRNMFLVAWTSEKSNDDVSFSDVQTAWEYERNTLDLTGPDATPLAKELALKGVSKMDGKTVAQINEMGAELSGIAVQAKIQTIEEKIGTVDAAITQLNSDKDEWKVRKEQAVAAEAALVEETKIYKPTIISPAIDKNWRGPTFTGKLSFSNPHDDPIYDFRNNFTIEHNGYRTQYFRVRGQNSKYAKQVGFILNLESKNFTNESGASLASDYVLPNDISAYSYSFRPEWLRTSGKVNGWTEYEYKLDPTQVKALYNLPAALKACDRNIEVAQKIRETFEAQVKLLETNAFDELRGFSGRYAESCL